MLQMIQHQIRCASGIFEIRVVPVRYLKLIQTWRRCVIRRDAASQWRSTALFSVTATWLPVPSSVLSVRVGALARTASLALALWVIPNTRP